MEGKRDPPFPWEIREHGKFENAWHKGLQTPAHSKRLAR